MFWLKGHPIYKNMLIVILYCSLPTLELLFIFQLKAIWNVKIFAILAKNSCQDF